METTNDRKQYCVIWDYHDIVQFVTLDGYTESLGAVYNFFTDIFDDEDGDSRTFVGGMKWQSSDERYDIPVLQDHCGKIVQIGTFRLLPVDDDYIWGKLRKKKKQQAE